MGRQRITHMPWGDTQEAQRFVSKVCMGLATECWLWLASLKGVPGKQYGQLRVKRDGQWRNEGAHRLAWEFCNGPIPAGLWVLHHCDNTLCVNPSHLFLGTVRDNNRDMRRKGRDHSPIQPGEQHWKARLTHDAVMTIRLSSEKQADLAKRFGINQSTISRVRAGKRWRNANAVR